MLVIRHVLASVVLTLLLGVGWAAELELEGFQHPILAWPILLEERSCMSQMHSSRLPHPDVNLVGAPDMNITSIGKETDEYHGDATKLKVVSPTDGPWPSSCPNKPWDKVRSPMIRQGLYRGPEIIYSSHIDADLQRQLGMSIMMALKGDQDSTCVCYNDITAAPERGLKCLCRAKGLGQMLNAALPEYLIQRAVALGEYPGDIAREDASHYLNEYRKELQRMSDDRPLKGANARTGRVGPAYERYKYKDAEFLRRAAQGRLLANGKLAPLMDYIEHPEANCTSSHMQKSDNLVPVETWRDEVKDMMSDMFAERGVFNPDRQKEIKNEVYDYYHKGWSSGRFRDTRKVHMPSVPHENDVQNALARELFGKREGVGPGDPDVGGAMKLQEEKDRHAIEEAKAGGNLSKVELAQVIMAVHHAKHESDICETELQKAQSATEARPSQSLVVVHKAYEAYMEARNQSDAALEQMREAQLITLQAFKKERAVADRNITNHTLAVKLADEKVTTAKALCDLTAARTALKKALDNGTAYYVELAESGVLMAQQKYDSAIDAQKLTVSNLTNLTNDTSIPWEMGRIEDQFKTTEIVEATNAVEYAQNRQNGAEVALNDAYREALSTTNLEKDWAIQAEVPSAVRMGDTRIKALWSIILELHARKRLDAAFKSHDLQKVTAAKDQLDKACESVNLTEVERAEALHSLGPQPGIDVALYKLQQAYELEESALKQALKLCLQLQFPNEAAEFSQKLKGLEEHLSSTRARREIEAAQKTGDVNLIKAAVSKLRLVDVSADLKAARYELQISEESKMNVAVATDKYNQTLRAYAYAAQDWIGKTKLTGDKDKIKEAEQELNDVYDEMTNFEARVQKRDGLQDFIKDRHVNYQNVNLPTKLHPQPYAGPIIRHAADLGTCCETSHAPGCSAKSVEECVCKHDNYCCQGKWDLTCIRLVKSKKCSYRKAPCPAILGATDEEVVEEEVDSKPKASEESDSGEGSGSDGSPPPMKKPPTVYCRDWTTNKRVPCKFIFNHIARNHKIVKDTAKLKRMENMEKRGQHIPEGIEKPVLPLKFKDAHQNITTVNHIRYDQDGKTTIKGSLHYGNPSKMYENTYDGLNTNESKSTYGQGCCYSHEEPGCEVPQIQDCVCAVDDSCCSSTWDDHCVKQLVKMNCGKCSAKDRVPPPPRVKNETEADGVMSDAVEKSLAKENSAKPGDSDAEPDEDWKFKRQSHWTQVEFTGDPGRLAKVVKEGVKRFGRANPMGQWGGNRIPEPNPEGPGAKPAYPYSSPEDIARMKRAAFTAKSRTWFDGQGVEAA